jgi:hypothetical protein
MIKYEIGSKCDSLTLIHVLDSDKVSWLAKCDCGNFTKVSLVYLKRRGNKSCGCLIKKSADALADRIRLGEGVSAFNEVYGTYKRHALRRGYVFELDKASFSELSQKNCFYCNQSPSNVMRRDVSNGIFVYNGIDRIDNSKGYEEGNVVPCCKICNRMKDQTPIDEFKQHIEFMLNNSNCWKRVS